MFKNIFIFKGKKAVVEKTMTTEDLNTIFHFANGDETMRERAIAVHRNNFDVKNDHNRFMSEVDTPSPDLVSRSFYRQKVLDMGLTNV